MILNSLCSENTSENNNSYGFFINSTSILDVQNSTSSDNNALNSSYKSYGFGMINSTYLSLKNCSDWSDDYGFYDTTDAVTNTFLGNTSNNNLTKAFNLHIETKMVDGSNPIGAAGLTSYDNVIITH